MRSAMAGEEWDEELERLREAKLREMMRRLAEARRGRPRERPLDRPVELTDENFDEFVRTHPLVVVDCWAPWCAPCRLVAPIVEELARRYAGRVVFGKLNVDENPLTAMRFGITGIPTLLLFKRGRLVDRLIGARPMDAMEAWITKYL